MKRSRVPSTPNRGPAGRSSPSRDADADSAVLPENEDKEDRVEEKVGRTFSARNLGRIQSAIDAVQQALGDLEEMIAAAMPTEQEAPQEEAALSQSDKEAGPDTPPTFDRAQKLAEIEQSIKEVQQALSEESK